jgi:hypothetical protein
MKERVYACARTCARLSLSLFTGLGPLSFSGVHGQEVRHLRAALSQLPLSLFLTSHKMVHICRAEDGEVFQVCALSRRPLAPLTE